MEATEVFLTRCLLDGNSSHMGGGALKLRIDTIATVTGCHITDNESFVGGGIDIEGGIEIELADCRIERNFSETDGGGINVGGGCPVTLTNNLIHDNEAANAGGGVMLQAGGTHTLVNNTVAGNLAGTGGGIWCSTQFAATVDSCILWNNGPESLFVAGGAQPTVVFSDVELGTGQPWFGVGCIDTDPLFVTGLFGDHYLSQVLAGQPADSPCVDTGSPFARMIRGTTRTDHRQDRGIVDMGFHYPFPFSLAQ